MPRGRKPKREYYPTLGGAKIRILRERKGLSLFTLAAKAFVDTAHLQRIEVGDIKLPEHETLDTILTALKATYIDRREVLEAFGYKVPVSLPTDEEIDKARRLCAYEMNDATYPIYLIDISQRLLAWNRYVPRLIGRNPNDPTLGQYIGITLFELMFSPTSEPRLYLDNPEEFVPAWLQLVKTGIEPYHEEDWYMALIGRARSYPGFRVHKRITSAFAQGNEFAIPARVGN
ncbi:MAG TPA: helix-turn-helix domain-containing protein [Herpetosiphonaceae bacterium]|nr:helix-turn-helix domain-containing protein [Herpetosiphonaceae bacterium]